MLLSCLRRGYVTHAGAAGKKRWPSACIGVKAAIAVERAAAQCPATSCKPRRATGSRAPLRLCRLPSPYRAPTPMPMLLDASRRAAEASAISMNGSSRSQMLLRQPQRRAQLTSWPSCGRAPAVASKHKPAAALSCGEEASCTGHLRCGHLLDRSVAHRARICQPADRAKPRRPAAAAGWPSIAGPWLASAWLRHFEGSRAFIGRV
jgi:hypothetical protein